MQGIPLLFNLQLNRTMKFIIDLIEDVREQIGNGGDFVLSAGLLKEDENDASKLVYAGEALIHQYTIDTSNRQLLFHISHSDTTITIEELMAELLILSMDAMMYELRLDVNEQYREMEIVGFGKNEQEKRYILFIKI